MFTRYAVSLALALSIAPLAACGKGEEAKAAADQAASAASAAADQAAAAANEAAEKAKQAAAEAKAQLEQAATKQLGEKKDALKKELQGGIDAFERKVAYLKEKAAKLPKAAQKKADEAFAAYDSAKTSPSALVSSIDGLPDLPSAAEVSGKITAALAELGAKVSDAEGAALKKK